MTGTFQEDTQISATAATFNQDMTLVSGTSGINIGNIGLTVGYDSSIGSLTPNTIRHNGIEYTIKSFTQQRIGSSFINKIDFGATPSFSKITLSIDGTEITFRKVTSGSEEGSFRNFEVTNYLLTAGETQTIKIISIE